MLWLLLASPALAEPTEIVLDAEAREALSPLERLLLDLIGATPGLAEVRALPRPQPTLQGPPESRQALAQAALEDLLLFEAAAGGDPFYPGPCLVSERSRLPVYLALAEHAEAAGQVRDALGYRFGIASVSHEAEDIDALARVGLANGLEAELAGRLRHLQVQAELMEGSFSPEAMARIQLHLDTLAVREAAWSHLDALRRGLPQEGLAAWSEALSTNPGVLSRPEVLLALVAAGWAS